MKNPASFENLKSARCRVLVKGDEVWLVTVERLTVEQAQQLQTELSKATVRAMLNRFQAEANK